MNFKKPLFIEIKTDFRSLDFKKASNRIDNNLCLYKNDIDAVGILWYNVISNQERS